MTWDGTVERARGLDPELPHESVHGEWSFIQTLRHLAVRLQRMPSCTEPSGARFRFGVRGAPTIASPGL